MSSHYWDEWWYDVRRLNYQKTRSQAWNTGFGIQDYVMTAYRGLFDMGSTAEDAAHSMRRFRYE